MGTAGGTVTRGRRREVERVRVRGSSEQAAERSALSSKPGGRRQRVLLVEEDGAVRDATRMVLAAEGFVVTTAASHAEALRAACESPGFDVFISDCGYGGSAATSVQLIDALCAQLGTGLAVILLTWEITPEIDALERQVRLRLASKPVYAERLLALVRELLGEPTLY